MAIPTLERVEDNCWVAKGSLEAGFSQARICLGALPPSLSLPPQYLPSAQPLSILKMEIEKIMEMPPRGPLVHTCPISTISKVHVCL